MPKMPSTHSGIFEWRNSVLMYETYLQDVHFYNL